MSKTISNDVSSTVMLTATYDPLLITTTGFVETTATTAIFGNASQAWHITNAGYIRNIGHYGIELLAGSTITNTGSILGPSSIGEALRINSGAGVVSNGGRIGGGFDGVVLTAGGTLGNTGTINGTTNDGVYIGGGAATVTNAGRISGGQYALQFKGSFADRLIVDPGAVFLGNVAGGSGSNTLELAAGSSGAIGTLTGFGTNFTGFGTLAVDANASWQLDSTSTVANGVALTDAGSLANAGLVESIVTVASGGIFSNTGFVNNLTNGYGVSLIGSGIVNNGLGGATSADIRGSNDGILANGGVATITNAGDIYGFSLYGVALSEGGKVVNSGTIRSEGRGVAVSGAAGTVANYGTIIALINGVQMFAGGTVTNTGTIEGSSGIGVYIGGGAATLTNSGSIIGYAGHDAVQFAGDFADSVIFDPGAVFQGVVQGGSGTNTLELAKDLQGATGDLTTFATEFLNFGTIAVDSGAKWQLGPTDTIVSGSVVTDAGTLTSFGVIDTTVSVASAGSFANNGTVNAGSGQIGVTLLAGGAVSNASFAKLAIEGARYGIRAQGGPATITNGSTIIGTSSLNGGGIGLYAGGTVINTGTIIGDGAAGIYIGGGAGTVTNAGSIGGITDSVKFSGSFSDLVIMKPGAVFRGKVQGGAGTNTLELAAGSASATGTLANFAFSFASIGYLNVDHGASWQFAASDTISSATGVTDNGTLKNAGVIDRVVTVADGGSLANSGTINGTPEIGGVYLVGGAKLTNTGLIENGCYFDSGIGTVSNSGSMVGSYAGVIMFHGGTVTNTGRITDYGNEQGATGVLIANAAGFVSNIGGTIAGLNSAVLLRSGGSVVNTGVLSGATLDGVVIIGGAGTVTNAGAITAGTGGDAVQFDGSFADRVIMSPGAVFNGIVQGGSGANTLELAAGSAGATGTLASLASFTGFGVITVDSGAAWQLAASNTIGSSVGLYDNGTLKNAGVIDITVTVANGASLSNSGTIAGNAEQAGVYLLHGGVLTNTGLVEYGCYVDAGIGTVTNSGTIQGSFDGVAMFGGGTVTNTGQITANADDGPADGVIINGGTGVVTNTSGHISGVYDGVVLSDGGTVANKALIFANVNTAVYIGGGAGTVTNAGTIDAGSQGYAVQFGGSFTDRVTFDAGASFIGNVQGGAGSNTLELAAGSAGVIGTLSAFAASFTNFGTIALDSNASWAFAATNTIGSGVTLTDAGKLSNAGLIDTSVTLSTTHSLGNSGTIDGGSLQPGVAMLSGGTLVNSRLVKGSDGVTIAGGAGLVNTSGTIDGATYGIAMAAGGTVHNNGTITSTSHGEAVQIAGGMGTIINTGSLGGSFDGVVLGAGGTVQNSGTISGGGNFGVYIGGGAGTITNSGTISGSAIAAEFTGNFTDRVIFEAGAVFKGEVVGGSGSNTLELAAGKAGVIGTLSSFASAFAGFGTLVIDAGANWENAAGSTIGAGIAITDAGKLTNAGAIESGVTITASGSLSNSGRIDGAGYGVSLVMGGTFANTGLIEGSSGGVSIKGAGSLTNAGSIVGTGAYAIGLSSENDFSITNAGLILGWYALIDATGPVTNSGTIAGGAYGVELGHGGSLTNTGTGRIQVTGNISGDQAVFITGGAGSVANAGVIASDATGVVLAQGGVVSNTGSISGKAIGVVVSAAGTITDAGTIGGGSFAVTFDGNFTDRVILDPGAVLQGTVQGGSGTNTLELAAGSQASAGTLASFGTEFSHFGQLAVDAGATWLLTSKNPFAIAGGQLALSLAAGATLDLTGGGALAANISGTGTLQLDGSTGFSFAAADALASANTLVIDPQAELSGTGSIASAVDDAGTLLAAGGTLSLYGALSGAGALTAGAVATADLLGGGAFAGSLGGGGTIVTQAPLTLDAGASVSVANFVVTENLTLGTGCSVRNSAGHNTTLSAATNQAIVLSGASGDSFINYGSLTASGGGTENVSVAFNNAASLTATSGTLAFLGAATNQGTIDASSGLVSFQTSLAGTGTVEVGSAGTLSLTLGTGTGQIVDFLAGTGLVDLAGPIAFHGTITGFGGIDRIDLLNTPETSYSYTSNVLTVKNGTTTVAALHFTGTSNSLSLTSDLHGGTFIVFN